MSVSKAQTVVLNEDEGGGVVESAWGGFPNCTFLAPLSLQRRGYFPTNSHFRITYLEYIRKFFFASNWQNLNQYLKTNIFAK